MKKIFLLFLFPVLCMGQINLSNPQTIGLSARNQKVGNGLEVTDTLAANGVVAFPGISGSGSSLTIDGSGYVTRTSGAAADSLVQTIAVNGWLSGTRIPQTFSNSLSTAITLIDSGMITVYPGNYTATANIAKDNVDWFFHAGATVRATTYFDLFNISSFTKDVYISGQGSFDLLGSFLVRHIGTAINVNVNFNSVRSRGDTCISLPRIIDTLEMVNIKGNVVYCDSFPANFYGYTQNKSFAYDVDSTVGKIKSAFRWDIDNDGGYHGPLSNISVKGRIFQIVSGTSEYVTWFGYVGHDGGTTFGRPIMYNVDRTVAPSGGRAFNMTNVDVEYSLEGHGIIDGSVNLSGGNGEHQLYFNISNFTFLTITGFKMNFFGWIYGIEGGSNININGGGGGTSTFNFFGYIRKAIINSATNTRATFASGSDLTKIGMFVSGNVIMDGYMRDTSGVIIQSGGTYLLNKLQRGDSFYAAAIEVQAGGTLELSGSAVVIQESKGATTFKTPIIFTSGSGTSSLLINGARLYGIAGGACYSVASGHTVNLQNLNCGFSNLAASVSGTVTSTITNGCAATNGVYDDSDLTTPTY